MTRKLIAAAAILAAMLACTKNEQPESGDTKNEGFQKGQQVTLNVTAGAPSTKVNSTLNDDGKKVVFNWEVGDKVKVTVDGYPDDPAVFTLSSGAGTPTATFTGKMPADGSKYTVQYPVNDPDITTQSYSSTEIIPHDMMKFTAENCEVSDLTYTLHPQYAALKLNFYGTNQTISKIVVTNTTSSGTYTLNISGGKKLSEDSSNPTPFFIVVPADTYNFSADVFDDGSSAVISESEYIIKGLFTVDPGTRTFSTSSPKELTEAEVLNMSAMEVTSPTRVYFSKGNLYYTGSAFDFESVQYSYHSKASAPTGLFRWAENSGNLEADITSALSTDTSLSGSTSDVFFTNATLTSPRTDFTVAGQTGEWRTLSAYEWIYLLDTRKVTVGGESKTSYGLGSVNGVKGLIILPDNWDGSICSDFTYGVTYGVSEWPNVFTKSTWSDMENAGCVFLPLTGHRQGSILFGSDSQGIYQSSLPHEGNENGTYGLYFTTILVTGGAHIDRWYGYPVRLVTAAQ